MNVFAKITLFLCIFTWVGCGVRESSQFDHEDIGSGEKGTTGDKGETGAKGEKGDAGAAAAYATLVDQNGTEIGSYLQRVNFTNGTFEIITIEGLRTVVDIDDASYLPPVDLASNLGFSCMYTSSDCSGSCYGVDTRARGYILRGQNGLSYSASSTAVTTSITSNSHNEVGAPGTCVVQTVALTTAVPTSSYSGVLTQTLSTPLYFKRKN